MKTKHVLRMLRTGQTAGSLPGRSYLLLSCDAVAWRACPEIEHRFECVVLVRAVNEQLRGHPSRVFFDVSVIAHARQNYGQTARELRDAFAFARRMGADPRMRPERPTARMCRDGWTQTDPRAPIRAWSFTFHDPPWEPDEKCDHCGTTRRASVPLGLWPHHDALCPPCRAKWLAHCKANPLYP